ncbi:MAG: CPBP family intramembrane metalloprotease [Candidatus Heimdallarchaeota archaeon]|nr:CPBP family intramembrane metalloprotease [Candidatus Heimdallarchaeota archaeon]
MEQNESAEPEEVVEIQNFFEPDAPHITQTALKPPLKSNIWIMILFILILYAAILVGGNLIMAVLGAPAVAIFFVLFILLGLLWFLIVPLVFKIPQKYESLKHFFRDIKLSKAKPIFLTIGLGLITAAITIGCISLSSTIATINGGDFTVNAKQYFQESGYLIYYSLIPGFWEEVAFRGVILVLLLKVYSRTRAIIINGLVFGFFHLVNMLILGVYNLETIVPVLFQVLFASALGIFFAYMCVKTNSLLPGIICHYLIDAFVIMFLPETVPNFYIFLTTHALIGIGVLPAILNSLLIWGVYKLISKESTLVKPEIVKTVVNEK